MASFTKILSLKRKENGIYTDKAKKIKQGHLTIINNMINREYSYLYKGIYDNIVGEYEQIIFLFGYVSQFIIIDYMLIIFFVLFLYIQRIVDAKKLVDFYNTSLFYRTEGLEFIIT